MSADTPSSEMRDLFSARAARGAARAILDSAISGDVAGLSVHPEAMARAAELAADSMTNAYPDLQIPPCGCWRDFDIGDVPRWDVLAQARGFSSPEDLLQVAGDLALLGAIAAVRPPRGWHFEDGQSGMDFGGVTGLRLAAFSMFQSGMFSTRPADPLRVDADALIRLEDNEIAAGFGVAEQQDGSWIAEMTRHLRRFGETVGMRPDLFERGGDLRPSGVVLNHLFDPGGAPVPLETVFETLVDAFAPLWPGGAQKGDVILGDVWARRAPQSQALPDAVPFHSAPADMAYGLIEPFAWAGRDVADLDALPGPSDAHHAMLFVSAGVVELTGAVGVQPDIDTMIALRAVTSALSRDVADTVRVKLGVDAATMPLPCIIEAGTARAGRDLARQNPEPAQNISKILLAGSVFWLPFGA
ncbi:MAG: DUF1688 family protein [Roseibium sp.]|nr:DUF1688 family protein [Roseibium sp.]